MWEGSEKGGKILAEIFWGKWEREESFFFFFFWYISSIHTFFDKQVLYISSPIFFGYNYGDLFFFLFLNDAELLNVVYCPKLFDFIYYGINTHGSFADFLIFMFNN